MFQSGHEQVQNRRFNQDTNRCKTVVSIKTRTYAEQMFQSGHEQVQNRRFNQDTNRCKTGVSIKTRTYAEQMFQSGHEQVQTSFNHLISFASEGKDQVGTNI